MCYDDFSPLHVVLVRRALPVLRRCLRPTVHTATLFAFSGATLGDDWNANADCRTYSVWSSRVITTCFCYD